MRTLISTEKNLYLTGNAYDFNAFNLPCHNLPEYADKFVMIGEVGEKGRFRLQC